MQIVNRTEGDDDYDAGSIGAEWVVSHQFLIATSYVLDCSCSTLQFIKKSSSSLRKLLVMQLANASLNGKYSLWAVKEVDGWKQNVPKSCKISTAER